MELKKKKVINGATAMQLKNIYLTYPYPRISEEVVKGTLLTIPKKLPKRRIFLPSLSIRIMAITDPAEVLKLIRYSYQEFPNA